MDISIKRDINRTLLVLPAGDMNMHAYGILSGNRMEHLMTPGYADGRSECSFEVPAGSILQHRYKTEEMQLGTVRRLLFAVEKALDECAVCLLEPDNLILRPGVIIEKDDGSFAFAAHPGQSENFAEGIRRIVRFCAERFSGTAAEAEVMEELVKKTGAEFFGFDELLCILGTDTNAAEPAAEVIREAPVKKPSSGLLLPAVLLVPAALLLLLFVIPGECAEPRFLLGSFICLASSAAVTAIRIKEHRIMIRKRRRSQG